MKKNHSGFSERLRAALGGETVHSFAGRCQIADTAMRKYFSGSMPGIEKAVLMAEKAGVSLEWLATGRGEMRTGQPGAAGDFVLVPLYKQRAAAGHGAAASDEQLSGFFSLRRDWVRATLGGDPAHLAILPATGDSMEPLIADGDLLLVDLSVTTPSGIGVYVLERDGDLIVKRVHPLLSGGLVIEPLNKVYPVETWSPGKEHGLRFVGRVRMVSRAV